jgi:uncharacterized protein (UPF0332 family)
MTALLYTRNIYAKTHQGMRAKFSEHFIKTGIFAKETSDTIAMLFDYRQQADYDLDTDITSEEASNIITKATGFYNLSMNICTIFCWNSRLLRDDFVC